MVRKVRLARAPALTTPRRSPRHQDHVAGLDRDVGAGADGDADVGLGQGRGVVDAVADEGDPMTLGLQSLDLVGLLLRQDLGQHPIDSGPTATAFAVRVLSPVTMATSIPDFCSARTASTLPSLSESATARTAARRPSTAAYRGVLA